MGWLTIDVWTQKGTRSRGVSHVVQPYTGTFHRRRKGKPTTRKAHIVMAPGDCGAGSCPGGQLQYTTHRRSIPDPKQKQRGGSTSTTLRMSPTHQPSLSLFYSLCASSLPILYSLVCFIPTPPLLPRVLQYCPSFTPSVPLPSCPSIA